MQNNSPLVSIVMPVHNGEKYIKEAVDSCINQTYSNVEIIVVDDGSTDNTLEILKAYKNKINVISVEKQNGLGNVLNIGIRESKGEYIARMDSDDIMYSTRISNQVEYLLSDPSCLAVGGQIDIIDKDGNITGHRDYAIEDMDIKKNMFLFQPFAHPSVTIRKSSLEEIGLYPENIWKVEDVKLFFLLSQKGTFHNIPDTVLKYRMTFDTQSQSDVLEHFKKTDGIRRWAVKELGIKPTFRELIIWNIQRVSVSILSILPSRMFMKIFEYTRKVLR